MPNKMIVGCGTLCIERGFHPHDIHPASHYHSIDSHKYPTHRQDINDYERIKTSFAPNNHKVVIFERFPDQYNGHITASADDISYN